MYIMHVIKTGQLLIDQILVIYGSILIIGGIFGWIMFDGRDNSIYSKKAYVNKFLLYYIFIVDIYYFALFGCCSFLVILDNSYIEISQKKMINLLILLRSTRDKVGDGCRNLFAC